jgi:hypothetical protein
MSRGGQNFSRDNNSEIERGDCNIPDWLSRFADSYSKTEKTAVEVARERENGQSIQDRLFAIMNGGAPAGKLSPYASVDEAVKDYQKRTGLLQYQKKALAAQIISAAEDESSEKKNSKRPDLIDNNPAIDSYINNVIDTQIGVQLPAVIHSILEAFGRNGISESDLSDPAVIRYISDILNSKKKVVNVNDMNLGKGVGTERVTFEINDSNRDPFAGLRPSRMF